MAVNTIPIVLTHGIVPIQVEAAVAILCWAETEAAEVLRAQEAQVSVAAAVVAVVWLPVASAAAKVAAVVLAVKVVAAAALVGMTIVAEVVAAAMASQFSIKG